MGEGLQPNQAFGKQGLLTLNGAYLTIKVQSSCTSLELLKPLLALELEYVTCCFTRLRVKQHVVYRG